MAIQGRSLGDACRIFVDHLNSVLSRTISQRRLSVEVVSDARLAAIRFRSGPRSETASLRTRYGLMELYIGQVCDSVRGDDERHTLRTVRYRYSLRTEGAADWLFRWEYVRFPRDDALYCQHHFQGPIQLSIVDRTGTRANLNDWHLPTGWVAIEEVLRFCIVDLGVTPLNENWDAILRESYERFRADISS